MSKLDLPDAKKVLIFNPARILVSVCRSVRASAELTGVSPQSISNAANGKSITASGLYWRHEYPEIEIEMSDVGELRLEEYDKLCGIERSYTSSRKIKNKRKL